MLNLLQLRKRIDRLDDHIIVLLNRRLRLAEKIGGLKARNGERVYNPERERKLLTRLCTNQKGPLKDAELRAIYRQIFQASRDHQARVLKKRKR